MSITSYVRTKLRDPIDKLFPNACYASLVTWSMDDFSTTLEDALNGGEQCQRDAETACGGCWCGKFANPNETD
jgi:hypothetical protein